MIKEKLSCLKENPHRSALAKDRAQFSKNNKIFKILNSVEDGVIYSFLFSSFFFCSEKTLNDI